jgi:hypothetical protein
LKDEKRIEKIKNAKRQLNSAAVANMTAARLTERDTDNEVREWLATIKRMMTAAEV